MSTSAEYRALVHQAYNVATERVRQAAATREPGTWAVIVDADETVLSNLPYYIEQVREGDNGSGLGRTAWQQRSEAPALPAAKAFLEEVRSLGGRIVVVTNRAAFQNDETRENLTAAGLPYDAVLSHPISLDGFKEPRFDAVGEGLEDEGLPPLEVVLYLGDRIGDFPEPEPDAARPFELFGDKYLILPNPIYGDWMETMPEPGEELWQEPDVESWQGM